MPSEDSTCAICDDSEGENSNAIVFCDGCNLAVHQGIWAGSVSTAPNSLDLKIVMVFHTFPKASGYVENAQFHQRILLYVRLSRPATSFGLNVVVQSCILCPNEGGAFKQTVLGEWVHLLCAIWVPETRVANEVFMEPITGVDKISKQRWKLVRRVCIYQSFRPITCCS